MTQKYFVTITAYGEGQLANAAALGIPLQLTAMAVGDASGVEPQPSRTQTQLINETYRAQINSLSVDENNINQVIAELVIPETVGGWFVREVGLYDNAGYLFAVANCPPSYKPEMAEGSGRTQVIRIVMVVSSADNITLKIDPAVVIATRNYVDQKFKGRKVKAGTGLNGGGDLSSDVTLEVKYGSTAGTAAAGDDSRIVGALQAEDMAQAAGNNADVPMSQKATTDLKEHALGKMGCTHTADATFTAIDNKILMSGIITELKLEAGDVIQFINASAQNNKPRTIESVPNDNTIIVNYEHCGARGNGALKLTDETIIDAEVKLLAKWFVAPSGLGQEAVNVTAFRLANTMYASHARAIAVSVYTSGAAEIKVNGLTLGYGNYFPLVKVGRESAYKSSLAPILWMEQR